VQLLASVAVIVKVYVAAPDVGVPERAPPAKLSPGGSDPLSAMVYGAVPPLAVKLRLYGVPMAAYKS
jgi:hypothetical protein